MILASILLFGVNASAKIVTRSVDYQQGKAVLEGFLAYDDAIKEKRPGIVVIHEWTGLNDYIKHRAEQLAALGYVAFAADIYGKGIRPKNQQEAAAQAKIYKGDRTLMRGRAMAGLEALLKQKYVDAKRVAAIGYCFGGTTALELARSGAMIKGVVSFHGGLDTPRPEDAKHIKGKVLALHGGDDPFVTSKDVQAFQDEMRKAGVDWEMNIYGGAVHSFTNPGSGKDKAKGIAYDERADHRSWEAMKQFLVEIFG